MLNQNCPEWQNGYPETMQKLKLYWNYLRRNSENTLFFICYDSTALTPTPTGFSLPFLTALSKFDGAICVVTSPPNPLSATERGSKNNSADSVAGELRGIERGSKNNSADSVAGELRGIERGSKNNSADSVAGELRGADRGSKNNSPSSVAGEGVRGWGFLQTFSPTQPNLIADIVGWMREKMMENL